jgi:hypothetical protein
MYLFERAYGDYVVHLRGFSYRLLHSCSGIWTWFWQGPGAGAIEVVLRIAMVVAAIGLVAMMYVRGSSTDTGGAALVASALVASFVFVYALILLWSWKPPLHFTARAVAGASAAGVVTTMALLAIGLASGVFAAYLLLLFALTALSFIVFLPMRAAHTLWLLYRHIAYRCPYDDCAYRGLPIHLCTCGTRYADLQPSFYGLFAHTCHHDDRPVKLPTMDWWGRNKLPRLCGGCQRPLIHSSLGELPEWPIAVVGGISTGKTVFLLQAIRQVRARLSAVPGSAVRFDSEAQERAYQRQLELLDRGQVVAKTAGDVMLAFGVAVRDRSTRLRCLLYLFDKPGEDFATMQRFGRMQVMQHVRGIVLLVDPFALPGLARQAQRLRTALNPSDDAFQRVVANLLKNVELMRVPQRGGKFTVPLAVVLSKADALPASDDPFLANLCPRDGHPVDDAFQARCRLALDHLGEGSSLRALEQRFATVSYFACSALGRMPDLRNPTAFQPIGVAEPLLWLLGVS